MKNKIIIFCFAIMLASMSAVFSENAAVNDDIPSDQAAEVISSEDTPESDQVNKLDEDVDLTASDEAYLPYKKPLSKKKLVKKFLLAMLAVAGSSAALYAGLSVYNKIRDYSGANTKISDNMTDLSAPDNLNGAIKTFLEKTRWE